MLAATPTPPSAEHGGIRAISPLMADTLDIEPGIQIDARGRSIPRTLPHLSHVASLSRLGEYLRILRTVSRCSPNTHRNGYAPPRRLTLSSGTIRVRRPRVRDTEERFESRLLPLFVHRTREVADLIPELYLHGLSEGDFDLALRGLLGEEAPIVNGGEILSHGVLLFYDSVTS